MDENSNKGLISSNTVLSAKEPLLEYLRVRFKQYRNTPLSMNELTEGYFGRIDKANYNQRWFFERSMKPQVRSGIKRLMRETGLHIYSIKKQGYVIVEKPSDFSWLIDEKSKRMEKIQILMASLRKDMDSTTYKYNLERFFGKAKITQEELNHIVKKKLVQAKIRRKRQRTYL